MHIYGNGVYFYPITVLKFNRAMFAYMLYEKRSKWLQPHVQGADKESIRRDCDGREGLRMIKESPNCSGYRERS